MLLKHFIFYMASAIYLRIFVYVNQTLNLLKSEFICVR